MPGNGLDDVGAVGQALQIDDARLHLGGPVDFVGGEIKELLVQVDLSAGDVILDDGREVGAGGQERPDERDVEAAGGEIDLLRGAGAGGGQ